MKTLPGLFWMSFACFLFVGCGDLAFWEQENSKTEEATQGIPLADMMVDENGDILAVMGDGEQMIEAASDGELAGTSIVFAAGALAIGTEVQVAVGSSLATATTQSELGMTGSMEQVSATVNIMANEDVVLQAPLTVAISISSAALNLADEMQYAILCKMRKPGTEGYSLEVWNDAKITFKGDKVEFQTMFFGSYQVIKIPKNITVPEPVVVTAPILSKAQEKVLQPLIVKISATKDSPSQVTISFTLQGEGSIEKCMLFPDSDGKEPFDQKGIDLGAKSSYVYKAQKTESLYFALGCRAKDGRELALAWTTQKIDLGAASNSTPPPPPPPAKSALHCESPASAKECGGTNDSRLWNVVVESSYYDSYFTIENLALNDQYRIITVSASDSCETAIAVAGDWVDVYALGHVYGVQINDLDPGFNDIYVCVAARKQADMAPYVLDKHKVVIDYQAP